MRKRSDKLLLVADIQGPLVEKDNLPGYTLPPFASSSLKPADLQRIFEEQAARNAQSRRKAIEDFHRFSGCHNDFQRIEACHLEDLEPHPGGGSLWPGAESL